MTKVKKTHGSHLTRNAVFLKPLKKDLRAVCVQCCEMHVDSRNVWSNLLNLFIKTFSPIYFWVTSPKNTFKWESTRQMERFRNLISSRCSLVQCQRCSKTRGLSKNMQKEIVNLLPLAVKQGKVTFYSIGIQARQRKLRSSCWFEVFMMNLVSFIFSQSKDATQLCSVGCFSLLPWTRLELRHASSSMSSSVCNFGRELEGAPRCLAMP